MCSVLLTDKCVFVIRRYPSWDAQPLYALYIVRLHNSWNDKHPDERFLDMRAYTFSDSVHARLMESRLGNLSLGEVGFQ